LRFPFKDPCFAKADVAKIAKTSRIAILRQTLTKALSKFALRTGFATRKSGMEAFVNSDKVLNFKRLIN
jgi:hypothetical protein